MNDATFTWTKSLTGTPTAYLVVWSRNGTALPSVSVAANSASDASGYSSDFKVATGVTPSAGDQISATVQAFDQPNNLFSAVVPSVPATVTIPTSPIAPGDPQAVSLVLS